MLGIIFIAIIDTFLLITFFFKLDISYLSKSPKINTNFLSNREYRVIRILTVIFAPIILLILFIPFINSNLLLYSLISATFPIVILLFISSFIVSGSNFHTHTIPYDRIETEYRKERFHAKKEEIKKSLFVKRFIPICSFILKKENKNTEKKIQYFIARNYDIFLISNIRNKFKSIYVLSFEIDTFNQNPVKEKIKLIDLLFRIACLDGNYIEDEDIFIKSVVKRLKLPISLFEKIKSRYVTDKKDFDEYYKFFHQFFSNKSTHDLTESYKILNLKKNCSDIELKKRYRKLAKTHHPDKVAYLGVKYIEKAENMFQKIQNAYDKINKNRKI